MVSKVRIRICAKVLLILMLLFGDLDDQTETTLKGSHLDRL